MKSLSAIACVVLLLLVGMLVAYPVNTGVSRVSLLLCLAGLWVATLRLVWSRRWLRAGLIAVPVLLAVALLLPGRQVDAAELRRDYVEALGRYEGVDYVWGGENRFGIDCSGLVRKGMIVAAFEEGVATANPHLLREAAGLWWFDSSALALRDGYRQRTDSMFGAPSLNALDASMVRPGDFAVTEDGVHTLAYAGLHEWIEADPGARKVIRVRTPSADNPWFKVPVRLVRWRVLE